MFTVYLVLFWLRTRRSVAQTTVWQYSAAGGKRTREFTASVSAKRRPPNRRSIQHGMKAHAVKKTGR